MDLQEAIEALKKHAGAERRRALEALSAHVRRAAAAVLPEHVREDVVQRVSMKLVDRAPEAVGPAALERMVVQCARTLRGGTK